ncbi:MFS transporter [Clostridium botulinum]|uniref:MFS transporter n=1 Tax=Clostridium botulinum C/D str. DC5 TaxID=1443128 RepID=A0A0A0IC52_CLOBO|nr:MFS transporter [Clostridium botulinum]KGM98497.1 MFS transporter [Clostridium botulinum C/D str. DC5]KOC51842.1 MFS transporter [Clostridium botulinum]KOC53598.1 MFS transporter [Clostridium botulinum]MCD3234865.1 MFS transporter [Clostridium botulinum D/C]MCD3240764.1 MFS transporter [Clostridium botulinum D/C]
MFKNKGNKDKLVTLILMMVSLNTIYLLPYLMYTYYTPLQEAMGLVGKDAAYGKLLNVYGMVNIILYLPGGWISDMFDAKKLLVISMISTGVLGLVEATWPSYSILMLIYILWSFTTVLTYWSSSIKCINLIADADEQGAMFGSLEAGRGVVGLILTTIFVGIYSMTASITGVVIVISIVMIVCGIAQLFLMPSTSSDEAVNKDIKSSIRAMKGAFKLPITYLLSAMIFGACIAKATFSYYTPFLEQVLGVSVKVTTIFANYNNVLTNIVGASAAAFFAAKVGRSTKPMIYAGIVMIASYIGIILLPETSALLLPFLLLFIIASLGAYVYRALYYAVIEEVGTPKNMVGSVIGISSLVGFIPDTFYLSMCGGWIEKYGTGAYRLIFATCLGAAVVGFIGAFISERMVKKHRKSIAVGK